MAMDTLAEEVIFRKKFYQNSSNLDKKLTQRQVQMGPEQIQYAI